MPHKEQELYLSCSKVLEIVLEEVSGAIDRGNKGLTPDERKIYAAALTVKVLLGLGFDLGI
jgi:hypothetical protein